MSFAAKLWASSRRSFCSSVSVKSTNGPVLLLKSAPPARRLETRWVLGPAERPIDWSINQVDRHRIPQPRAFEAGSPARARRPMLGPMAVLALSTGDAILIIVFATIPVAALTFIM